MDDLLPILQVFPLLDTLNNLFLLYNLLQQLQDENEDEYSIF